MRFGVRKECCVPCLHSGCISFREGDEIDVSPVLTTFNADGECANDNLFLVRRGKSEVLVLKSVFDWYVVREYFRAEEDPSQSDQPPFFPGTPKV